MTTIDPEALARAAYERRWPGCWDACPWVHETMTATAKAVAEAYRAMLREQDMHVVSSEDLRQASGYATGYAVVRGWSPPNHAEAFARRLDEMRLGLLAASGGDDDA